MNFYPDHLYVNFDGTSSSAMSNATTPHATLTRTHVNAVKMNNQPGADHHNSHHVIGNGSSGTLPVGAGGPGTPRSKLRSPSQHSMPSGRTSSVVALSERSVTGASSTSYHTGNNVHPSERVGLLSASSQC